jgi:F-type H+-transporting ATPase subunit c
MRKLVTAVLAVSASTAAFASGAAPKAAEAAAATGTSSPMFFLAVGVAAILGLAFAAAFCGLAQGWAISKAVEGIARQPEAAGKIQGAMLLGLVLIESLTIYVLVVALILLFANPFLKYLVG